MADIPLEVQLVVAGRPATSWWRDRVQDVAFATVADKVTSPSLVVTVFGDATNLLIFGFATAARAVPEYPTK